LVFGREFVAAELHGLSGDMLSMTKPILVVTTRYTKEVEDRIDRDYNAR